MQRPADAQDKPIQIQEIVFTAIPMFNAERHVLLNPTGEFDASQLGRYHASGDALRRITIHISSVMDTASEQHQRENYIKGTAIAHAGTENNITRAITNEFLYFTKEPLTLRQFESLMQTTLDKAKSMPDNIYIALGTFAVETPDHKVMNVLPHITCGHDPHLHLIVKNHPSVLDPQYSRKDPRTQAVTPLPYTSAKGGDRVHELSITVNSQKHAFSYNSAIRCQTTGGQWFYACYDICADHYQRVAVTSLHERVVTELKEQRVEGKTSDLVTRCIHTIVSNHVASLTENLLTVPTHVDPFLPPEHIMQHAASYQLSNPVYQTFPFGRHLNQTVFSSIPCPAIPASLLNSAVNIATPPPTYEEAVAMKDLPPPPSYESVMRDDSYANHIIKIKPKLERSTSSFFQKHLSDETRMSALEKQLGTHFNFMESTSSAAWVKQISQLVRLANTATKAIIKDGAPDLLSKFADELTAKVTQLVELKNVLKDLTEKQATDKHKAEACKVIDDALSKLNNCRIDVEAASHRINESSDSSNPAATARKE